MTDEAPVMGRPKLLTPELIGQARGYLATCQDVITKDTKKVNLPKIEGLALFLHVSRETIYVWEKENADFSDIVQEVREAQITRLIDNGLSGGYQHNIAALIMGKHGYRSTSDITTNDKDLPAPILGGVSLQNEVHTDNDGEKDTVTEETS